jgi:hypothetical protein
VKSRTADLAVRARLVNPIQLTADANDWNPAPGRLPAVIRVTSSTGVNITGLRAPDITDPASALQPVYLHNMGASNVTLKNASTSSAAANRFDLVADVVLTPSRACVLQYDPVSSRWRVVGDQTPATLTPTDNTVTTAKIVNNAVDDTKLRQGGATSVIGRSANSTGNVADIAASADGQYFRRSGGTLGFAAIASGDLPTIAGRWLARTVVLNGTTTFTTGSGTNTVLADIVAGGAGGGGCAASIRAGAGGGGAGGRGIKKFAVSPSTGYTVAVGAKGTGATAGANAGNNGNDSTFTVGGTTVTAKGGTGGPAGASNTAIAGGAGGVAGTNGDINAGGAPGSAGLGSAATSFITSVAGNGGSGPYGGGGLAGSATATGGAATGFGAGGAGASNGNNASAQAGGNGSDGVIIADEFS